MKMKELKDAAWIDKYRPTNISEIVCSEKTKIIEYLKSPDTFPSLLLHSSKPGTGKTSLSNVIINELGCNARRINASDDRTLETIRNNVKEFARSKSTNGIRKCIFMDEFDGMPKLSQESLRNIIETYSNNVFFIFTCNNINKIIPAIQSRCLKILFTTPNKTNINQHLTMICKNEGLVFTNEGIDKLIHVNYPSIRDCVMCLQDLYTRKLPVTVENIIGPDDIYSKAFLKIKQQSFEELFNDIYTCKIDSESLNNWLFDNVQNLNMTTLQKMKVIQVIAVVDDKMTSGCDKNKQMCAGIIKLMSVFKEI